jgi:alcohol dehydrogenase (cytochrome c)
MARHLQRGHLKAFDPSTGKEVWSRDNDAPMVASVLATAGDLVFTGEPTGEFNAERRTHRRTLWQFNTGSGIHSNAVTYSVNGKQYIAVPSGWGGRVKGFAPDMLGVPRGDALFVFELPE